MHVPRAGAPGATDERVDDAGKVGENNDDGEHVDDDSAIDTTLDVRTTPLAVLPEPVQPTPVPSPPPPPVPAFAIAADTFEDGGLEYVDEPGTEDPASKAVLGDAATEPPPSPAASGYGSSGSMERVLESLTDPSQLRSHEGSPQMQLDLIKEEEAEAMDLSAPDDQFNFAPSTSGLAVQAKDEVVDDDEGSEGSVFEGEDILELAQQFLLR